MNQCHEDLEQIAHVPPADMDSVFLLQFPVDLRLRLSSRQASLTHEHHHIQPELAPGQEGQAAFSHWADGLAKRLALTIWTAFVPRHHEELLIERAQRAGAMLCHIQVAVAIRAPLYSGGKDQLLEIRSTLDLSHVDLQQDVAGADFRTSW
jgi:hypothetical protein